MADRRYRDELANLSRRENRLYFARWPTDGRISEERANAIERAQHRIWSRMHVIKMPAISEEQDEIWPDGLPAHP